MVNASSSQRPPIQVIAAIALLLISFVVPWAWDVIRHGWFSSGGLFVGIGGTVELLFLYGLYRGSNAIRWFVVVVCVLLFISHITFMMMPRVWFIFGGDFWRQFLIVINGAFIGIAALLLSLPASGRWYKPNSIIEPTCVKTSSAPPQVEPLNNAESTMLDPKVTESLKQMRSRDYDQTHPSMKIILAAVVVWIISIVASSMYVSGSNLGFIFVIFVAGPIGILVGALIGVVWSALHAGDRSINIELVWLALVWILSLFYSLAYAFVGMGILPIGLQWLMVASGAFLLRSSKVNKHLPEMARKCGKVVLFAAVLIIFTSMFPPVNPPWRAPQDVGSNGSVSELLPKFVIFSDPGFDASRNVPKFTIDRKYLAREWFVIAAIAGLVCLFFIVSRSERLKVRIMNISNNKFLLFLLTLIGAIVIFLYARSSTTVNTTGTKLIFRTPPGAVSFPIGQRKVFGEVDVSPFRKIRVLAFSQNSANNVNIGLTITEGHGEWVGRLDTLNLTPRSELTKTYDVPGTKLTITAEATESGKGVAYIGILIYGSD
ncbi:MAG: hypothetical protein ACU84H_16050 [Gammaproteobacteria bacterium]